MIAYVYNLPSWISNPDNKPSYNLWQIILNNHGSSKIECKTISQPTLTSLFIQSSYSISNWYKYNYVNFNNLWYIIDEVNYVSDNNQVVEIKCHIDIYLSFIVQYFDENSTLSKPVFFIQKHLNRWMYKTVNANWGDGTLNYQIVDFSKQFYLKNKHQGLAGIGQLTDKTVDVVTDYQYNGAKMQGATSTTASGSYPTPMSQITLNNDNCVGYLYYVWIMTQHENAQAQWNQFSTMGLMNVSNNPNFWTVSNFPIANYPVNDTPVLPSNNTVITCIPWWYAIKNFGQSAYIDLITLPVPVEFALIYTENNSFTRLVSSYNNVNETYVSEVVSCIYNYAPNSITDKSILVNNMDKNFILIYNVIPQNLYYFFTDNPQNTNNYSQINNILTIEPYIFQYTTFRVRGGGEDAIVDLTAFDNFYTSKVFVADLQKPIINMYLENSNNATTYWKYKYDDFGLLFVFWRERGASRC